MMYSKRRFMALSLLLAGLGTLVRAQTLPAQSRGDLLYSAHCITCHTTQMHWRKDKQAYDWDSLKFQVRRWQGNAGLAWSEADITEVSLYLNETIYRYLRPNDHAELISPAMQKSVQACITRALKPGTRNAVAPWLSDVVVQGMPMLAMLLPDVVGAPMVGGVPARLRIAAIDGLGGQPRSDKLTDPPLQHE